MRSPGLRRSAAALLLIAFLGLIPRIIETTRADSLDETAVLVWSNRVVDEVSRRSAFARLECLVGFNGVHSDPTQPDVVPLDGIGIFYTDEFRQLTDGRTGTDEWNEADMEAEPLSLRARILNDAWCTKGAASFVNTTSGVRRWYVLRGGSRPVTLRADIGFHGSLFGDADSPGAARAFFSHLLHALAYPADLTNETPLAMGGAVLPAGEPYESDLGATLPDLAFVSDGTQHDINRVGRSNPFLALPDMPFAMTLTLNAAASTTSDPAAGESRAWSDFVDASLATSDALPGVEGLTPEGFVVDLDGDRATHDVQALADLGYTIEALPDTSTSVILSETASTETTLTETITDTPASLTADVTGSLDGTLSIVTLELVEVSTGPFAGKGFLRGAWSADLAETTYSGDWTGFFFPDPAGPGIRLHGRLSGGIVGVTEGSVAESDPGSGTYDRLRDTWTLGEIGGEPSHAVLEVDGAFTYGASTEHEGVALTVRQLSASGTPIGHFTDPVDGVLTHVRVTDEESAHEGLGFSTFTYRVSSGEGLAYTRDELAAPGIVQLRGMATGPLAGTFTAVLDETGDSILLSVMSERLDLGLPPMADPEVITWNSWLASPGMLVGQMIQYENRGLTPAENGVIIVRLPPVVEFVSCTGGGRYDADSHEVRFDLGTVPLEGRGYFSLGMRFDWWLWSTVPYVSQVLIGTESEERNCYVSAAGTVLTEEWLSAQVARANTDWDIRDTPPGYDPDSPDWGGYQTDTFDRRVREAIALIKRHDPDYGEYVQGMYDRGKIHADATIFSSEWNGWPGVRHIYLNAEDLKLSADPAVQTEYAKWDKHKLSEGWLADLAGKILHEARHSRWQYEPSGELGEMQAFHIEATLLRSIIKSQEADGNYKAAKATAGHLRNRWQDLKERAQKAEWEMAERIADRGVETADIILERIKAHLDIDEVVEEIEEEEEEALDEMPPDIAANAGSAAYFVATAWDPNVKHGPEGAVLPGQKMEYRIEFENVGEGWAFGVYFVDTLDEALDAATLTIGLVHSTADDSIIAPAGTYDADTRTITWFVGEVAPGAGGYADIELNLADGVAEGTEIFNYGTIYFPSVPQSLRTNGIVSVVRALPPPVAVSEGPYEGRTDVSFTLDGTGSHDLDGAIVQYEWDFDDDGVFDETATEPTVAHTWVEPYTGKVRLRVTDDDGLTGEAFTQARVARPVEWLYRIVDRLPDGAFAKKARKCRKKLRRQAKKFGKLMAKGKGARAIRILTKRYRKLLDKLVLEEFERKAPDQFTKAQALAIVDEMLAELEGRFGE